MFDTILIGTSGLLTHAKGLRIVGNNLANVNTPGFKSSQLQFASLFDQGSGMSNGANAEGNGAGLTSLGTAISFRAGLDQSTGNPLDMGISGNGFFAVRRDDQILYTRSGDFGFNNDGLLVNSVGDHVLGLDSGGKLVDINLNGLGGSLPKATTTVKLTGNITSTVASPVVNPTLNGVSVIDANGVAHTLNLSFQNAGSGTYVATVFDSATGASLATGNIKFTAGFPAAGQNSLSFSYATAGVAAFTVKLDFADNVTSLITSTTLGVASQDGYAAGVRTDQTIGADGIVTVHYSNGQTAVGPRVAMADFKTDDDLEEVGGSAFRAKAGVTAQFGYAGNDSFGKLMAGHREGSNVDLAEEFGNLILMQRGYQASSHVISTANDMIQELFDMKGHR
jgi:flagellar hook protein FlgE